MRLPIFPSVRTAVLVGRHRRSRPEDYSIPPTLACSTTWIVECLVSWMETSNIGTIAIRSSLMHSPTTNSPHSRCSIASGRPYQRTSSANLATVSTKTLWEMLPKMEMICFLLRCQRSWQELLLQECKLYFVLLMKFLSQSFIFFFQMRKCWICHYPLFIGCRRGTMYQRPIGIASIYQFYILFCFRWWLLWSVVVVGVGGGGWHRLLYYCWDESVWNTNSDLLLIQMKLYSDNKQGKWS